jgi:hypothetical protein
MKTPDVAGCLAFLLMVMVTGCTGVDPRFKDWIP